MEKASFGAWGARLLALGLAALLVSLPGGSQASGQKAPAKTEAKPADAVSAASEEAGWSIALTGKAAASWTANDSAQEKAWLRKDVEKKGEKLSYSGIPLSRLLARVDGSGGSFDASLWATGYDVTLTAKDGYSATFNTKEVAPDALIVSDEEKGAKLELPLTVGSTAKNLWVRDLVSIATSLAPSKEADKAASFKLELDINGAKSSWTLAQLETLPFYFEGRGAYTTSAGTRYEGKWSGVKLRAVVETGAKLDPSDSVTFVATDGYEMTYSGAQILDEKDGEWMLAFKMDGEYLPEDPGYVRTIKAGPKTPNIDGHLSVRMVKRIVLKQKAFRDFSVSVKGATASTLDRSTIMSCASCHRSNVSFERKAEKAQYSGFPLWLLMGYADDAAIPHKQDKSVMAYDAAKAAAGYAVTVTAKDGFKLELSSKELNRNDQVILALYKDGEELPDAEAPLVLVWDKDAKLLPAGIKNVKGVAEIGLKF